MYPEFGAADTTKLMVVIEQLGKDPNYLNRKECPYNTAIKSLLSRLALPGSTSSTAPKQDIDLNDPRTLFLEVSETYRELKMFSTQLSSEDVAEHMSYFRTRTTLLERLYELLDAVHKADEYSSFKRLVLQILEDLLTDEQRTSFLERLERAGVN